MQLVAKLDSQNQARLEAFIRLPWTLVPEPITFLVDTGCSTTCLLPDDVVRLGVKHADLPTVTKSIITANGPVALKLLRNVEIALPVRTGLLDKEGQVNAPMSEIPILPPGPNFKPLPPALVFSLLGMDLLSHFPKWRFGKTELVMEEENQSLRDLKMSLKL